MGSEPQKKNKEVADTKLRDEALNALSDLLNSTYDIQELGNPKAELDKRVKALINTEQNLDNKLVRTGKENKIVSVKRQFIKDMRKKVATIWRKIIKDKATKRNKQCQALLSYYNNIKRIERMMEGKSSAMFPKIQIFPYQDSTYSKSLVQCTEELDKEIKGKLDDILKNGATDEATDEATYEETKQTITECLHDTMAELTMLYLINKAADNPNDMTQEISPPALFAEKFTGKALSTDAVNAITELLVLPFENFKNQASIEASNAMHSRTASPRPKPTSGT